jgi:GrpB-like predicted nucleotidyltransferase (UPF0157 family)
MTKVHFRPSTDFADLAKKVFELQKKRITELLPYANVQHIGSTSIPNSITKGDLDVVIRVPKKEFKHAVGQLKSIYNINQQDNWSDTFASFKDEKSFRIDFGAQLVISDSKSDDFTKLRDILLQNPELVEELNTIKLKNDGKNTEEYRKEKAGFCMDEMSMFISWLMLGYF